MPRKYAKRRRRRRKRNNYALYRKPNSLPFPKTMVFKTRYFDNNNSITTGIGGTAGAKVYRITSLYDLEAGLSPGHQPIGYDQLAPLYNHYVVVGAKILVRFTNLDGTRNPLVGISLKSNGTVEPNPAVLIENGRTKYSQLSGNEGNRSQLTLTHNYSAKRFFGGSPVSKEELRGEMLQSTDGNPIENAFMHVWQASDSGAFGSSVGFTVDIQLTAILTEPKTVQLS